MNLSYKPAIGRCNQSVATKNICYSESLKKISIIWLQVINGEIHSHNYFLAVVSNSSVSCKMKLYV